jgi:hypothetical protein
MCCAGSSYADPLQGLPERVPAHVNPGFHLLSYGGFGIFTADQLCKSMLGFSYSFLGIHRRNDQRGVRSQMCLEDGTPVPILDMQLPQFHRNLLKKGQPVPRESGS